MAGRPARAADLVGHRGRRDHRGRAGHRRRLPASRPGRLGDDGSRLHRFGPDGGRAVLGRQRDGGRRGHRRARARYRPRGRPARGRAGGEDPVYPGHPGVQRPAELGRGHRPAAARGHRPRHRLRGGSRRARHRPAAGSRHGRPGRPGQPGRGRRQPGRADGGGVRAAPERGAGGPGRRRRSGSGPGGLPGRLPRRHRGGRGQQERAGRLVQQQALVRVAGRPGRRAGGRGPARRLRADQLHQHVQRHRGRRGRPHPVPVPAPHRGSGRPGADQEHHPRQYRGTRHGARRHRRGPGGRPGHVHQRRRGARLADRHAQP